MEDFASYFILGFIILFGVFLFLIVKNRLLFTIAYKQLGKNIKLHGVIISISIVISYIISSSLFLNDSFLRSLNMYVNSKIGYTSGVIRPIDESVYFTDKQLADIYSLVGNDFGSFLPVAYEEVLIGRNEDPVVLHTFDPQTAQIFNSGNVSLVQSLSIAKSEVVISQSLARKYSLNQNSQIQIRYKKQPHQFTIKEIIPDNGLVGFNLPLQSRLTIPDGSLYVSNEGFATITGKQAGMHNLLLLSGTGEYKRDELVQKIQPKVQQYSQPLVFEELRQYLLQTVSGQTINSINFGQVILVMGVLPFIISILIFILLNSALAYKRRNSTGILQLQGLLKSDILKVFLFEIFFTTLISGIIGTGLGALGAKGYLLILDEVLNQISINQQIVLPLSINLSLESILFSFTGVWIILFLISALIYMQASNIPLSKNLETGVQKRNNQFSAKKFVLIFLFLVVSGVILYFGGNSDTQLIQTVAKITGILIIIYTSIYAATFIWGLRKSFTFGSVVAVMYLLYEVANIPSDSILLKDLFFYMFLTLFVIGNTSFLLSLNSNWIVRILTIITAFSKRMQKIIIVGYKSNFIQLLAGFLLFSTYMICGLVIGFEHQIAEQFNQNVRNSVRADSADVLVVDEFDKVDVSNILKDNTDIKSIAVLHSTDAVLPKIQYKDIKAFDENVFKGLSGDTPFMDTVVATTNDTLQTQKIITNQPQTEAIKALLSTNSYVLLGKNYAIEQSTRNIRPDLKIGDTVTFKVNGTIEVTRTVLGIFSPEEKSTTINQIGERGLVISEYDYTLLKEQSKVYFNTLTSIDLHDGVNNRQAGEKIRTSLKNTFISNIIIVDEYVEKNTELYTKLFTLGRISFIVSLLMIAMISITIRYRHILENQLGKDILKRFFSNTELAWIWWFQEILMAILPLTLGFMIAGGALWLYGELIAHTSLDISQLPFRELAISIGLLVFVKSCFIAITSLCTKENNYYSYEKK